MLSPICVRNVYESRGQENLCRCPKCREEADHDEAIDYYRRDLPENEMFPEKTGKNAD